MYEALDLETCAYWHSILTTPSSETHESRVTVGRDLLPLWPVAVCRSIGATRLAAQHLEECQSCDHSADAAGLGERAERDTLGLPAEEQASDGARVLEPINRAFIYSECKASTWFPLRRSVQRSLGVFKLF